MADMMRGLKRTNYCGELSTEDIGKKVTVCGWVSKQRDLGNLIFIDLRDRSGIIQLAFDNGTDREVFEKAASCRSEFVLMASGEVRERESKNNEIKTGSIEVYVSDLRILSKAETPPFEIVDDTNVKEELRLKYRYLDLRRPVQQQKLILRHKVTKATRDFFDSEGFLEIETPMLISSTPEGARDYLVPSRIHKGSFYALPQSPQMYKQLLMVSGYDKYFQLARCFRDEDLRADRQPEFTQIDLEMSFVEVEDVLGVGERFIKYLFKTVLGVDIETPIKRMTFAEAMDSYGSDKPDTRFDMKIKDISDIAGKCGFSVFSSAIEDGGKVAGICAKNAVSTYTRKEIDKTTEMVKGLGAKGLAWIRLTDEAVVSSFSKFMTEEEMKEIIDRFEAKTGDVIFIIADKKSKFVQTSLGSLRCDVARKLDIIENKFNFLWITEFPFFEWDDETQSFVAMHHPFTSPLDECLSFLETDKAKVKAKAYDLVLNGIEMSSGSIRITDPELQSKMFSALGMTDEEAHGKFGFLTDAFKYGAPPHGGMAIGLDRLVMQMAGCDNLRQVVAFPKVQNASELMTSCPTRVDKKQLDELSIKLMVDE